MVPVAAIVAVAAVLVRCQYCSHLHSATAFGTGAVTRVLVVLVVLLFVVASVVLLVLPPLAPYGPSSSNSSSSSSAGSVPILLPPAFCHCLWYWCSHPSASGASGTVVCGSISGFAGSTPLSPLWSQ